MLLQDSPFIEIQNDDLTKPEMGRGHVSRFDGFLQTKPEMWRGCRGPFSARWWCFANKNNRRQPRGRVRRLEKVELPSSNFKTKIADILKNEGFIKDFKVNKENNKSLLSLELKYHSGNPVISTFERVSKPGRRIFSSAESLPKINNGLGIAIVSTPKGVMTDIDARKQRVGGEIICKVF